MSDIEYEACPRCGCFEPVGFIRDDICLKKESEEWLGIKIWNAEEEKEFRKLCRRVKEEIGVN